MSGAPPDAISISDLARQRGISKQAVHKRAKALEAEGRLKLWAGPGRSVLISASAYDHAVGVTGDPVKEMAAESAAILRGGDGPNIRLADASPSPEDTPAYRDAKARDAYYAAELKRLAYEEADRKIYRVEEVEASMVRMAGAVSTVTRGLVALADEGAEACEQGMPAFRRWLVRVGDDMCRALAAELRVIAREPSPKAEGEVPAVSAADDEPRSDGGE